MKNLLHQLTRLIEGDRLDNDDLQKIYDDAMSYHWSSPTEEEYISCLDLMSVINLKQAENRERERSEAEHQQQLDKEQ